MRLFIACLAALALLAAPAARACPPDVAPDGGGSFSSFGGYGADMCEAPAPMIAGNFGGAGYGGGAMVAAPSYSASFVAPAYAAPLVQRQVFAAPAYGYGAASFAAPVRVRSFGYGVNRRFGGGFGVGSYGAAVVAAPVVHTRAFAAPVYGGAAVVAAPVVAVPVRAVGPIRGAIQGFRGGLRNRLNGF